MDPRRNPLFLRLQPIKPKTKPQIDPKKVLKFRKYLTLQRSDMDLLHSMEINPITMRNAIKKFLKTKLIAFKTLRSCWSAHAGYICSHIHSFTIEEDRRQYVPMIPDKKKIHNFLKRCQNLESLKVEKVSSNLLRNVRYLCSLKSLDLVLDNDEMGGNLNMVRDLRHLRYVCIKFQKLYHNNNEQNLTTFCEHLLKSKSLEKIELELSKASHGEALESVLQCISKMDIDFTIRLCLKKNMLNIDKIKYILAKTETLILQYTMYEGSWQNDLEKHSKLRSERTRITQQGHRILHFILKEPDEYTWPVIQACSSLQTLWIEKDDFYQDFVLKQFSFPKTLKNLFVVLPHLSLSENKRFRSSLISALNDVEMLETLFLALPLQESVDEIDKLKDLNCIRNSPKYHLTTCFVPNSFMGRIDENLLTSLCGPIATMDSLKYLKLDFERSLEAPVEYLQRMLDLLPKKLEKFELVISAYDGPGTAFDLYFPFEMLSQLAEFHLDLCYPLSTDAGNQFTKEFVKMKELEVMVVKGRTFWDANFEVQKIAEGLKQMTKIRDVHVSTGEKESFSLKDYFQMIQKGDTELKNKQIRRIINW